jgi:hypothetical protein
VGVLFPHGFMNRVSVWESFRLAGMLAAHLQLPADAEALGESHITLSENGEHLCVVRHQTVLLWEKKSGRKMKADVEL